MDSMEELVRVGFERMLINIKEIPYLAPISNLEPYQKPYYEARGVEDNGDEVVVRWNVEDVYLDYDNNIRQEYSRFAILLEMCHWESPSDVIIIEKAV